MVSTLGLAYFDLGFLGALGIYCASGFSVFALGIFLLAFNDYRNENAGGGVIGLLFLMSEKHTKPNTYLPRGFWLDASASLLSEGSRY